MTAAIYYHPEAYTTDGPKLMGRNAAGEGFLRGFLLYSQATEFWLRVQHDEYAQHFSETAKSLGRQQPVRIITGNTLGMLADPGMIYFPGPGLGDHACQRAAFGHGAWSICGITHTTSSALAMDALAGIITAPVQSWDVLICTSTAVKANVKRVLQAQAAYLKDRLGITKLVLPELPVIPLGIHPQDFVFNGREREQARAALQVAPDEMIVLYMGRLSFHAKAHPLAMYQALERAAQASAQKVVLVECGWYANEHVAATYAEAARLACPSVRVVTLDGRNVLDRQTAWACADVFCSLSDNIQESFGIAPLEAMAAGLPVVVSDWDGYKESVRDGIDGFRIPTLMPQPGLGGDLALRHALEIDTYDMYCGHTCSLVAVDVLKTAQAFSRLFESASLRKQMGEAGRQRVQAIYDWSEVIPQYEALWAQQYEIRRSAAGNLKKAAHPWPARLDPFYAYAHYSSQTLMAGTRLQLVDGDATAALRRVKDYQALVMVNFVQSLLPAEHELEIVIRSAASGAKTAQALVKDIPAERRLLVFRTLSWLVKLAILKVAQ
ncbi:MAG: glycosyltransferase family 4 protein [Nitrosomonas sp.]|nr:MAG: glycosyltransferase family 4 protein [Nitrosomonas sp.]